MPSIQDLNGGVVKPVPSLTDKLPVQEAGGSTVPVTVGSLIALAGGGGGGSGSGGGGGLALWQTKTANYTAIPGDRLRVNCTSGNVVITLPATPLALDSDIAIQKVDSTANIIIINPGSNNFRGITGIVGRFTTSNLGVFENISYVNSAIGFLNQHGRLNFQSLTVSDPLFAQVAFLLLPVGANGSNAFVDSSTFARPITTVGDASITANQAVFDGVGDRLTVPASSSLAMQSSNFCFEFEFKTTQSGVFKTIMARDDAPFSPGSWSFLLDVQATNKLSVYLGGNTPMSLMFTSTAALNDGINHHIAWDRSGNTFRFFVDGNLEGTLASAVGMPDIGTTMTIGDDIAFSGRALNGSIKAIRITRESRYTSNFTPPTVYPTN